MRTFHIVNLGCKVNRVEADSLAAALIAAGDEPAALDGADLVVVNTCTVTGEADKKARKATRHALSANPTAQVVVTGCAAAISPGAFADMSGRVLVVPKGDLLKTLGREAPSERAPMRFGAGFRTRVGIKVQDGCDHACTYCIVHVARGKARSMPFNDVVGEARAYLQQGVKELVLTGIDLASYSEGGRGIAQLTAALLEEADKAALPGERACRIRASSMEPHTVGQDFIDLMAESEGSLCRHLHLPLQSGSTMVLREMARPYTAESFASLVSDLRCRIPQISLTTDIICGFPGETDDDFAATMQMARACGFSRIHVFPYSRREGTPAAARADQVDPELKADRCAQLRKLAAQLRVEDRASRAGTCELAVVENDTALTESYHELPAPANANQGELVPVAL